MTKKREDKIVTPEDWTRVVRKARPSQSFQIVHTEHSLTNNLAPEQETPLLRIIDYKRIFEPMLNNRLFLQRVRKVRFSRNPCYTYLFVQRRYHGANDNRCTRRPTAGL